MVETTLFDGPISIKVNDNEKAPVHRWYQSPMSFSHKLVECIITNEGFGLDNSVLDPFAGSGTTLISAKMNGVNVTGVEKHNFLFEIIKGKLSWDISQPSINSLEEPLEKARKNWGSFSVNCYPSFVKKCYSESFLKKLKALWRYMEEQERVPNSLKITIMSKTLRDSLCVKGSIPYVQPSNSLKDPKDPFVSFKENLNIVKEDLSTLEKKSLGNVSTVHGDARQLRNSDIGNDFDAIITSPPYLNNIDYADHTRLELYFFGYADSWNEITDKFRSELLTSATTQVKSVGEEVLKEELSQSLEDSLVNKLYQKLLMIRDEQEKRSSPKKYASMMTRYFIEMKKHLEGSYKVLKNSGSYYMVVGDSALYGVHIPTDKYLISIAESIGFNMEEEFLLKERGGKFNVSQRHNKKLKESLIRLST